MFAVLFLKDSPPELTRDCSTGRGVIGEDLWEKKRNQEKNKIMALIRV
jgi:hypothetical protein